MLHLKLDDLEMPGMNIWREEHPKYKKPLMIVSWSDLILLNPGMRLPNSTLKLETYFEGTDSVRMVWNKKFQMIYSSVGVQVEDISHFLDMRSFGTETLKLLDKVKRVKKARYRILAGKQQNYFLKVRNYEKICECTRTSPKRFSIRRGIVDNLNIIFVKAGQKLKAIASVLEEKNL